MRKRVCILGTLALALSACQSVPPQPVPQNAAENTMTNHTMNTFSLPEIPPAKLFQHVTPEIMTLDNGIPVWYVHSPMIPLMSMRAIFADGASSDPADKAGRANFTAAMLKEGANGKTAQQISDEIELLGATISPSVTQDTTYITVQSLTQFFEQSVDIMHDIWMKPDFTKESFERLQKIVLNGLTLRGDNPNALAKLAANRAYFGDDHPYARSTDGYIDTISSMQVDDLKAAYHELFSVHKVAFIAVGDMPTEAFRNLLNERFGKIEVQRSNVEKLLPPIPEARLRLVVVDKPNAPQTIIRIYQPAVVSTSMKTLTWQFVNIPFGGSFTSRLMQNIREDKGFSYGASAGIAAQQLAGVLVSSSSVASEVTGAALAEFLKELSRLPKGDFSQDEFERARETWKSELVQSFETQSGVLATIAGLYMNRKSTDAINGFARDLQQYTLDDFNQIAREFPTPQQATITLVGDKATILEQLKSVHVENIVLPEPEFRDLEGKRITP